MSLRAALLLAAAFISAPALADEISGYDSGAKLPVAASFSIIGDMARQIGGDKIALTVLAGAGEDMHIWRPSPQTGALLAGSAVFFVNGLEFEGWLGRLVRASSYRGRVVPVSRGASLLRYRSGSEDVYDPHAWQDPANGRIYLANIAAALIAADPAHESYYRARHRAYRAKLDAVAARAAALFAGLPPERRAIITAHEGFAYFGRAYGLRVFPVAAGGGGVSAGGLAALVRRIRRDKIAAIFPETSRSPRFLQQLEAEADTVIGGALYSDALSLPSGPAADYLAFVRYNAETVAAALERRKPAGF